MTMKSSLKKSHHSSYSVKDNNQTEDEDYEDDSDSFKLDKSVTRTKSNKEEGFNIIGQSVNIKTTYRKEVYHDQNGKRVYGSWK